MKLVGGVLLGAGMVLALTAKDYLGGDRRMDFMLERVVAANDDWVTMDGTSRPTETTSWQYVRVQVRVAALKRSLSVAV